MQASSGRSSLRRGRLSTYTAYSIGCAVVWAVLWAILATTAEAATMRHVLLVFLGWVIGWTSATIARVVYPPPKKRRLRGATSRGFEQS